MTCSVNEAKQRVTPQEFRDWLEYFSQSPPLKEYLNYSQANISYTLAAVNKGKGQKSIPLNKFLFDFKKVYEDSKESVSDKVDRVFGALVKNGKK
jgi:hypothetical protein